MTLPAPHYVTTPCRGCGKQVVFITDNNGKRQVLDPVSPVFHRIKDPDSGTHFWIQETGGQAMVSHFRTCSRANDFSGKNRKEPT